MSMPFRWIILYWMPYDNNLAPFEQPIIKMIQSGVGSNDVLVIVQSDTSYTDHMCRSIISDKGISVETTIASDSSSAEAFADYIVWVRSQFEATHWAFVFLGHGGRLDEFSPDMRAGTKPHWMSIHNAAKVISDFRKENNVELIFLQNCCKGTLEANYTFRNCADYTLSSQTTLGAPNYYYEETFRALSRDDMDGAGLASQIIDTDSKDMYTGYVVVNNTALRNLSHQITPLLEAVVATKNRHFGINEFKSYRYALEQLTDVSHFFEILASSSARVTDLYKEFDDFYRYQLIKRFSQNPYARTNGLSGLSILLPSNNAEIERYRYLEFYQDVGIEAVFRTLIW